MVDPPQVDPPRVDPPSNLRGESTGEMGQIDPEVYAVVPPHSNEST